MEIKLLKLLSEREQLEAKIETVEEKIAEEERLLEELEIELAAYQAELS